MKWNGIGLVALLLAARPAAAESRLGVVFGINASRLTGELGETYPRVAVMPIAGVSCRWTIAPRWRLRSGLEWVRRGGARRATALTFNVTVFDSTYVSGFGPARHPWYGEWLELPIAIERDGGVHHDRWFPYASAGVALARRIDDVGADPGAGAPAALASVRRTEARGSGVLGVSFRDGHGGWFSMEAAGSLGVTELFASGRGPSGRAQTAGLRFVIAP